MGLGQEWEGGSRGRGTDERLGDGAKEEDTPPKGGGHQGVEQEGRRPEPARKQRLPKAKQGGYLLFSSSGRSTRRVLLSRDKLRSADASPAWKIDVGLDP